MVLIGKLLDLNKTEAAEKLKELYLETENSISMVKPRTKIRYKI
jgi:hypothetical protein